MVFVIALPGYEFGSSVVIAGWCWEMCVDSVLIAVSWGAWNRFAAFEAAEAGYKSLRVDCGRFCKSSSFGNFADNSLLGLGVHLLDTSRCGRVVG